MKRIVILLMLIASPCFADNYQAGETIAIVYPVVDSSGDFVTGETVRLTIRRVSDGLYHDFSDQTFKVFENCLVKHQPMNEDATSGVYIYTVTFDTAATVSDDYIVTISNESATYADHQVTTFSVNGLNKLIRIHR